MSQLFDDAEVFERPKASLTETKYTRVPRDEYGREITATICERMGGHTVPVDEWPLPPRKTRVPYTSGVCTRCETHVLVYATPGRKVTPVLPDGTRIAADGTVITT